MWPAGFVHPVVAEACGREPPARRGLFDFRVEAGRGETAARMVWESLQCAWCACVHSRRSRACACLLRRLLRVVSRPSRRVLVGDVSGADGGALVCRLDDVVEAGEELPEAPFVLVVLVQRRPYRSSLDLSLASRQPWDFVGAHLFVDRLHPGGLVALHLVFWSLCVCSSLSIITGCFTMSSRWPASGDASMRGARAPGAPSAPFGLTAAR